ncbi:hypothetical protein [Planomonospora sp. ID82291]|uniref:hypothetical protein n=1 Tax=Planomonospora sp. ID82291 TaxID=2738136 RepID=UPI0018C40A34|nr:hypothetical protein [Planomonospora sp. ID82291]MBG0818284.1 hypothetical protein [Planomonospora sp. ID82291]
MEALATEATRATQATVDLVFALEPGGASFTWTDPATAGGPTDDHGTADHYKIAWEEGSGRLSLHYAVYGGQEDGYRLAGPIRLHNTGDPVRLGQAWPLVVMFVAAGDWRLAHPGNPFNRLGGLIPGPDGPRWDVCLLV